MITFPEMPYERPDPEELKAKLKALTERLQGAKSYEEAKAVFLEKEKEARHVDTLATLASVRHSIDTRDTFYDEENKFWNQTGPELQEFEQAWTAAMLASPFRADFEAEYGNLMFINAEIDLKTFSPDIIPELQQENEDYSEPQEFEDNTFAHVEAAPAKMYDTMGFTMSLEMQKLSDEERRAAREARMAEKAKYAAALAGEEDFPEEEPEELD